MKVTWEVDDGYVGKSRPQTIIIKDSVFDDMTEEEKMLEIEEWVSEDFSSKVGFTITHIDK